jgi:hypothetical protein
MPDVAEVVLEAPQPLPTIKKPPHRFTPQNARAYAIKSNNSPKRDRRRRKQPTQDIAQPVFSELPQDFSRDVVQELKIVSEQIARAREVLNDRDDHFCSECERGGLEPQHRAQLLKALDALLDRKRILQGRALPGSLRPVSTKAAGKGLLERAPAAPRTGGNRVEQE